MRTQQKENKKEVKNTQIQLIISMRERVFIGKALEDIEYTAGTSSGVRDLIFREIEGNEPPPLPTVNLENVNAYSTDDTYLVIKIAKSDRARIKEFYEHRYRGMSVFILTVLRSRLGYRLDNNGLIYRVDQDDPKPPHRIWAKPE